MSRYLNSILILSSGLALAACGGSDSNSGNDDGSGGGGGGPSATITGDNTLEIGQEATAGLGGIADAGDSLEQISDFFDSISMSGSNGAHGKMANTQEWTSDCPGGGTLTISASDNGGAMEQTITYDANQCADQQGNIHDGEMVFTYGEWDEYPGTSFEMTMETGDAGLSGGGCEFRGGLQWRLHMDSPEGSSYGEYFYLLEYGTTDAGFHSICAGESVSLAANTLVRNEFRYSITEEDGYVIHQNDVTMEGGVEAPDGSGQVVVTATNLEYGVDGNESEFGGESCPTAGYLTIEGADGSSANVYFGEDAPPGYAVQVTGPDGYVAEFETCQDFLDATD